MLCREERVVFLINDAESNGYSYILKINHDPYYTVYTKINSRYILDLKCGEENLLEENIGNYLYEL